MEATNRKLITDKSVPSPRFHEKATNMSPGDPLDLLKGISNMFVSYEPNFGFENTLDFCDSSKSN